ncbi:hypothetical protein BsWGS_09529 [Bradybaena similaris]
MSHHAFCVILLVYMVTKTVTACDDSPSPTRQITDNVTNQADVVLQPMVNSPQQSVLFNTTEPPPVTAPMIRSVDITTTEDVCISLCSVQLGGEACHCDVANVPG